jgi:hypothetical protein
MLSSSAGMCITHRLLSLSFSHGICLFSFAAEVGAGGTDIVVVMGLVVALLAFPPCAAIARSQTGAPAVISVI